MGLATKFQPPGGVAVPNPLPLDAKRWNRFTDTPYTDEAQVFTVLPIGIRHPGLVVDIAGVEHWWPTDGGVTDGELVLYKSSSSEPYSHDIVCDDREDCTYTTPNPFNNPDILHPGFYHKEEMEMLLVSVKTGAEYISWNLSSLPPPLRAPGQEFRTTIFAKQLAEPPGGGGGDGDDDLPGGLPLTFF